MEKLLKDKALHILIVAVLFIVGIYFTYTNWQGFDDTRNQVNEKQQDLQTKKETLSQLEAKKKASEVKEEKKTSTDSGKKICEVSGQQFTPEASFGVMFEDLLNNIKNSGVRIRSIDYNYQPAEDMILGASPNGGFNACELSFVTVGSYIQFQNFFKNVAKEKCLSSIYEIYIEPYDKDKTILITRFKIRLYTKTI